MSAHRIESYMHSDSLTENKGGSLVKVSAQTDFAVKNVEFISFAIQVAKVAFMLSAENWDDIVNADQVDFAKELVAKKENLEKRLKEKITIEEIKVIN